MRRAVVIAKIVLWACTGLMAILVILSWVAPGLRDERSFLLVARRLARQWSVRRSCSGGSCATTGGSCVLRGGRAATSPSRRAPSGRPRCFVVLRARLLPLPLLVRPARPAPFLHLSRSHGPQGEASTGSGPWRARARSGPVTGSAWEGMLRPRACEFGQGTWGGRMEVRGLG